VLYWACIFYLHIANRQGGRVPLATEHITPAKELQKQGQEDQFSLGGLVS
jgi:hypothetical protein